MIPDVSRSKWAKEARNCGLEEGVTSGTLKWWVKSLYATNGRDLAADMMGEEIES